MADLTITAANVKKTSGNSVTGTAGATITAGQALYLNASDNKLYLADVTTSTATAAAVGIALHAATADQPVTYAADGATINPGATMTVGETYVVSASGAISPHSDLTTNDYVSILGVATAATTFPINLLVSGAIKP